MLCSVAHDIFFVLLGHQKAYLIATPTTLTEVLNRMVTSNEVFVVS